HPGLFSSQPFVSPNGTLHFTTATDAYGTATVSVRAHDDGGTANGGVDVSDPQSFLVTVTPVNDAPRTQADEYRVLEDGSLAVPAPGVLLNDRDPEGDPFTASLVTGPQHGALAFNSNGSFSYQPNPNFSGDDTYTYRATESTPS